MPKKLQTKSTGIFEDKIVMIDPKKLKINPFQSDYYSTTTSTSNTQKYEHLKASIKKYGIKTPLQINKGDAFIIAGHRRTFVALELGIAAVPCRMSKEQLKGDALRIHLLEDNYLQRDQPSQFRKKAYADMMEIIRKNIPEMDFLVRESKSGFVNKLESMGLSSAVATKISRQERRIAAKKDNAHRSGVIIKDHMQVVQNLRKIQKVLDTTNAPTKKKIRDYIQTTLGVKFT